MADVLDLSFCPWKSIEEVCSFFLLLCFLTDDFGVQTRSMISKKPSTEKQCIKLLSLFLFVFVGYTCEMLARFGDSLPSLRQSRERNQIE